MGLAAFPPFAPCSLFSTVAMLLGYALGCPTSFFRPLSFTFILIIPSCYYHLAITCTFFGSIVASFQRSSPGASLAYNSLQEKTNKTS